MTLSIRNRRQAARCRKTRVWLNGVEVTRLCFYADGRRGVVRLYRENERGQKFLEPIMNAPHWDAPMRVATEERRGRVRWGRFA